MYIYLSNGMNNPYNYSLKIYSIVIYCFYKRISWLIAYK
jgi:hypothetical protein